VCTISCQISSLIMRMVKQGDLNCAVWKENHGRALKC
jgi:hypothetical protein